MSDTRIDFIYLNPLFTIVLPNYSKTMVQF